MAQFRKGQVIKIVTPAPFEPHFARYIFEEANMVHVIDSLGLRGFITWYKVKKATPKEVREFLKAEQFWKSNPFETFFGEKK